MKPLPQYGQDSFSRTLNRLKINPLLQESKIITLVDLSSKALNEMNPKSPGNIYLVTTTESSSYAVITKLKRPQVSVDNNDAFFNFMDKLSQLKPDFPNKILVLCENGQKKQTQEAFSRGTISPDVIERNELESMHKQDIEPLYDRMELRTPLTVRQKFLNTGRALASQLAQVA